MALAPFLGIQPPPVLSPRGNAEEEIALQALQHMKNVPPSSLAGNANAASGAVGTRTPQRTSATRGEGARAHARDAIRGRSNPGRPGTRRDARDAARVEDARPPRTRARVDDVVRSRQTRDSNRRTRRRARPKKSASIPFPRIFLFFPNRALRLTSSRPLLRFASPQPRRAARPTPRTPRRRFPTTRTSRSRRSPTAARPRARTSSATSSGSTRKRRSARAAWRCARRRRRRRRARISAVWKRL
jgi:hypothetical protein